MDESEVFSGRRECYSSFRSSSQVKRRSRHFCCSPPGREEDAFSSVDFGSANENDADGYRDVVRCPAPFQTITAVYSRLALQMTSKFWTHEI